MNQLFFIHEACAITTALLLLCYYQCVTVTLTIKRKLTVVVIFPWYAATFIDGILDNTFIQASVEAVGLRRDTKIKIL